MYNCFFIIWYVVYGRGLNLYWIGKFYWNNLRDKERFILFLVSFWYYYEFKNSVIIYLFILIYDNEV